MRLTGSRTAFTASVALALLLVIAGLVSIVSASGHTLLGFVLIGVGGGLYRYAKQARAVHLHQRKMTGLWQWAQALGPRKGQGRRP